jgi:hypothetical protein
VVDTAKLDALSGEDPKKQPAPEVSRRDKKPNALDEADDKLSGLFGDD